MNLSESDKQTIVAWARRHPEIQAVYLYGSRARGDNKPDSDIDLGVTLIPTKEEPLVTWMDWIREYRESPDLRLDHPVQLEWYEKGANLKTVGGGVERDGILLYQPQTEERMTEKKSGMTVEGEPTKRFGVSYGGDVVGSFDTATEALAARKRHADLVAPIIDPKKKYDYSFRDGRKEISIEQLRQLARPVVKKKAKR